jgi:mRNA interferase RelE/StbE
MRVEILDKCDKDIDKLADKKVNELVLSIINEVLDAENQQEISNIKKLKGYKNAYRIRIGRYRIGVYIENDLVEFARILSRKDIYKFFP